MNVKTPSTRKITVPWMALTCMVFGLIAMLILGCSGTLKYINKKENRKDYDKLIEMLSEEESWIREEAAYALGRLQYKPSLPQLLVMLEAPEEPVHVKIACAFALIKIKDPSCIDPIINELNTDPENSDYRYNLVKALAQYTDDRVIPVFEHLKHDRFAVITEIVCDYLNIGEEEE